MYDEKTDKFMNRIKWSRLLLMLSIGFFFWQCSGNKKEYYEASGFVFGTSFKILYSSNNGELPCVVFDSLFSIINRSLSPFEEQSIISRVNRSEEVEIDSFFSHVFLSAQTISKQTNGAFDITVAPLVNAWGFGFEHWDSITPSIIDSLRQFVGYQKVVLRKNRIIKENPGVMLDCSAIAKGYSCDVVANYFREQGISDYMIEVGGEIVTQGLNSRGKEWVIGITQPSDENSVLSPDLQERIVLGNGAMATSGNYRQFYYKDGHRYAHTINPVTGYPVEHSLLSVTVLADDCMTADALATAFMVMGLDSALTFVENRSDLAAYFIYSDENDDFKVIYTPSFENHLIKNN